VGEKWGKNSNLLIYLSSTLSGSVPIVVEIPNEYNQEEAGKEFP